MREDGTMDTAEEDQVPDTVLVPDTALEEDDRQSVHHEDTTQHTVVAPETMAS